MAHKRALVLSGGGAKGAFTAGAVKYLMVDLGLRFDLVIGTSTGALVAPLVATQDIADLLNIYENVEDQDILEERPALLAFLLSDALNDSKPLEELINRFFGSKKRYQRLVDSSTEMFVAVVNMQTGEVVYGNQHQDTKPVLLQKILASASVPVMMPPVKVGRYQYVDGGVKDIAPLAYVEHHFNSSSSPAASYTVVITGANASQTSRNWGRWYAAAVAGEFNIPIGGDQGIVVGGYDGRGDFNLRFTEMPAILLEPLFASNPQHAIWISGEEGQDRLARILCDSIQRFFQKGGLTGFSVGHKYKSSNPNDLGAGVFGAGWEANYAEAVLERAKTLLEKIEEIPKEREIKVVRGNTVLWKTGIDADANAVWDGVRGVLSIEPS